MKLPVALIYHVVAPCPPDADPIERSLFVEPGAFEQQIDDLAAQGYRTLTLDAYAAAVDGAPGPPKSVLLTFDDAYAHVDAVVSPILRRYQFSAVMFTCPAHLGGRNSWDRNHPNLARLEIASREQLLDMSAGSWEIASHGLYHVDLRTLDPERRRTELAEARDRLSHLLTKPVVDLAYPYGSDDPAIREDVRQAGYRLAFVATPIRSVDPLHLSRQPVNGADSLAIFRLKTAGWSNGLYRMSGFAPGWVRTAARTVLGAGAR
jgi:peptidoglycan/xylan/chitin deacetylase (PgdA/CDA1 family)